jgi:putative hemolysin
MRDLPNPLSSITDSFLNKNLKKTMSEKIAPIHQIIKDKIIRIQQNSAPKKNKKNIEAPAVQTNKAAPISVSWARHQDEVKEAQRLRYKVFAEEMGANLKPSKEGLDVDIFDSFCDHLIVRDNETLKVIGTYRALPPHQAKLSP